MISKINPNRINFFIFLAYSVLTGILIYNHEIWLDEAHHWLISVNSKSISDLLVNIRYEGHPILWNLILHFAGAIFPSFYTMKVIHFIFALSTSAVIIFYSPFTTLQKILVLSGYFILFEYSVISRNYALGVLLIIISAVLLYKNKIDLRLFFCLILLPQTNLYGLLFSIPLFCFYFPEIFKNIKSNRLTKVYLPSVFYLFSVIIALFFIFPPSDHPLLEKLFHFSTGTIFKSPFIVAMMSLFSFPDLQTIHWWNSNLFVSEFGVFSIVAIVVPIFIYFFLYKVCKQAFWFLFTVFGLITLFTISTQFISSRYFGYCFIAFLFVLIVHHRKIFNVNLQKSTINKMSIFCIYLILVLQSMSGLTAVFNEFNDQFSGSYKTAGFIKSNGYSSFEIAVSPFNSLPPISLYLERNIFSPETNNFESFCRWNLRPFFISENEIIGRIKIKMKSKGQCIFITPNKIENSYSDLNAVQLNYNEETVIKSERYYTYLLTFK